MKNPCVSIIVPAYNVEKWLSKCIDSLLAQTYEDFQLILVDDGSSDGSGIICDEYAKRDPRVEVIHQKNGGLSNARNTGIEHAKGEYLSFVDGDDFCEKDMLKIALENFSEDIDIVVFGFCRNSKKITVTKNIISKNFNDALSLYIDRKLNVSAWGKVYRKNIFENIRFPEGKLFEDMWIFPAIAENKILILNKILYNYVLRDGSITTVFSPKHLDFLSAVNSWKDVAKKYGKKTENLVRIARLRVVWNLLLFLESELLRKGNEAYVDMLVKILRKEKNLFIPVKGFVNFIFANLVAYGFPCPPLLNLRYKLRHL